MLYKLVALKTNIDTTSNKIIRGEHINFRIGKDTLEIDLLSSDGLAGGKSFMQH